MPQAAQGRARARNLGRWAAGTRARTEQGRTHTGGPGARMCSKPHGGGRGPSVQSRWRRGHVQREEIRRVCRAARDAGTYSAKKESERKRANMQDAKMGWRVGKDFLWCKLAQDRRRGEERRGKTIAKDNGEKIKRQNGERERRGNGAKPGTGPKGAVGAREAAKP